MRFGPALVLALLAAAPAGQAHADTPTPAPAQAPFSDPPPPPTYVDHFGGQILFVDLGSAVVGVASGGVGFISYPFGAPIVHLAHHDYGGAGLSFLLHAGAPIGAGLIGASIETRNGCSGEVCGLGGFLLGGLLGAAIATTADVALLADVERPVPRHARKSLPTPTVTVAPGRPVVFGLAGRF